MQQITPVEKFLDGKKLEYTVSPVFESLDDAVAHPKDYAGGFIVYFSDGNSYQYISTKKA
jgi:hypothetical protein